MRAIDVRGPGAHPRRLAQIARHLPAGGFHMPQAQLAPVRGRVADPRLILPLDLPTRAEAQAMVEQLGDAIVFYKIGLQLLAGDGVALAGELKRAGRDIFLDWKLHDIGATVERATAAIAASGACDFLTVHAEPQVMAAAVRGRDGAGAVKLLGVTVL